MLDTYLLVLFTLLCVTAFALVHDSRKVNTTIKGPRRIPLIGNIVSTERIWVHLAELSKQHGWYSILPENHVSMS